MTFMAWLRGAWENANSDRYIPIHWCRYILQLLCSWNPWPAWMPPSLSPRFSGPGVSPSNGGQGLRSFFEILELQSGIIRCICAGWAGHLPCARKRSNFINCLYCYILSMFGRGRIEMHEPEWTKMHICLCQYVHFCGAFAFRSSTIHTNQRRKGRLVTQPEPTHQLSQQTAVYYI